MLPRMDQFKTAIFCPRIIAFNESFVPLGGSKGVNIPYAVLWNESVSGRSQADIMSSFRSFFMHKRDIKISLYGQTTALPKTITGPSCVS